VSRLHLIAMLVGLAWIACGAGLVSSQAYPGKPVRIVVTGAGSGGDFAARLIGKVDRASVPSAGVSVKENSVCFLLHSGPRTVRLVSPVDGVIKSINPKVASDPSLLNEEPYSEGWIFSVRLQGEAVKGLYHETVARKWFESEVERLHRVFSSDLGMTAMDGGEPHKDIGSRLNEAQWGKIVSQFLG